MSCLAYVVNVIVEGQRSVTSRLLTVPVTGTVLPRRRVGWIEVSRVQEVITEVYFRDEARHPEKSDVTLREEARDGRATEQV